jgi:proline iminopeptidase
MAKNEGYVLIEKGLRLHYRVVGSGPDTVVIPAAAGLADDLGPLAQSRRLIFYDQRGRGQSDVDPNESSIWSDYEVHDLEAIRQHFDLEQMSIIGWSYMGAMSALYAADYPERVKRLVLMCAISPRSEAPYNDPETRAKKENERIDPEGAKRLREMQQQGLDRSDPETYCREFHRIITPRQMGRPEALARMRSDPCAFPNEWPLNKAEHTRKHVPAEAMKWDWRQRITSVQALTLVIHGEEDLIPLESSREWANTLPQARLLVIPGSGHFPHLEAPEEYFPAVERFLSGGWPEEVEEAT